MNTDHLKYLVEIGALQSINKASSKVFRSRSSIISAMNKLEQEIGHKLFNRDLNGVTLTEYGQRVYRDAQFILQVTDSWKSLQSFIYKRNVVLHSLPSMEETHTPVLCSKLLSAFPKFKFEYETFYNDVRGMVKTVMSDNAATKNIILGGYHDIEQKHYQALIKSNNCVSVPLFQSKHSLYYNNKSPLINTDSISLANIFDNDIRLLIFKGVEKSIAFNFIDKKNQLMFVPSLSHVFRLIELNERLMGLYPSFMYDDKWITGGHIRTVECDDYDSVINYCLIYNGNLQDDKQMMSVVDFIRAYFTSLYGTA